MPTTATTQPDPICPTESQLALLGRIAQRAKTGCPLGLEEALDDEGESLDLMGLALLRLAECVRNTGDLRPTPAGHATLEAGLATKQCASDGCTESFTFEPEDEEVSYCSERCEDEQGAREAGERLHDQMKEGL